MPLAFVQCKLQQSRSALLLISRLTKKQHFPPAPGLSFSLTAQPLRRALAAQGARKVKCPLLLSPASKWVPGFTRPGAGQHFHHALRAYTVYASAHIWDGWVLPKVSPALQGGAGQQQLLKLPPHLIPSLVMSRRDWRPQKQQTADSPPCSGCCPWPPLSPRLSPAERLAFRQGQEGSGVMGSYPQRRMVWKTKPVTASRTQRPLMGVLTRPPICPLPLLVCPPPSCGVWGERKGRTIE